MDRPLPNEFAPYYANYISLVPDGRIEEILEDQPGQLSELIGSLPEEKGTFAYAPGKWTIKELLSHILDGERIFAYRVLRISRGDQTPIEGFEQDDYIATSNANNRSFAEMLDEFELQRRSNAMLVGNLSDDASQTMGVASGVPVSARAIVYIMAGHVTHHLNVLRSKYLVN